jgi:DNA polymerase
MHLKRKDIVVVDFETYYSNTYSLKKKAYNISSYVWDPQFKIQCVSIKDGLKAAVWYDGKDCAKAFKKHDIKNRPVAAHNTHFDGFILSQHFGIVPPMYLDTLAMARALHGSLTRNDLGTVAMLYGKGNKKPNVLRRTKGVRNLSDDLLDLLGDYCAIDADLCFELLSIQLPVMPLNELLLIDWTTRIFCDPVLRIDQQLVKEEYDAEINRKESKQALAKVSPKVLQSAELFAEALRILGVTPPTKISPTTGETTYAFSKTDWVFTDLLNLEDQPEVVALVEARLATKSTIGETRAKRFADVGIRNLPVGLSYCAAHTTRWGGTNKMNLQNLERPEYDANGQIIPDTGRLRRSIMAPPGHVIGVVDSGQIEARINAWLAGQDTLLEAFKQYDLNTGPDPYKIQAALNYDKPIEEVTKNERFIGKICVLALGYKMGWKRLQNTLALGLMGPAVEITDQEAQRLVRMYRITNDRIVALWDLCYTILVDLVAGREGKYKCIEWSDNAVWLPNGLGLHYHHIEGISSPDYDRYSEFVYYMRGKPVRLYDGLLLENIIQGLARTVIAEQLLNINSRLLKYKTRKQHHSRVVSMSHDELIAVFPDVYAEEIMQMMYSEMKKPTKWAPDLPLSVEGNYNVRYTK